MEIQHLIFLIHPCCYESLGLEASLHQNNLGIYFEREEAVKQRWLDAFSQHNPSTLYLQLGGPAYLRETAQGHLGEANACYVQAAYPGEGHLREYHRRLTRCIRDHMEKFSLHFDPATVTSELWGESFEGCVPGYGGAFAEHLGLVRTPRMRFDMTVYDSRFLYSATAFEPITLACTDIEAWVFECYDRTSAAIYQARLSAQWLDTRPIHLQLDPTRHQVWTKTGFTVWPEKPAAKGDSDAPRPFSLTTSDEYWIRGIGQGVDDLRRVVTSAVPTNRKQREEKINA